MLYKCNSCGGQFVDPQPDGARYFHVCPTWTPSPTDTAPIAPLPVVAPVPTTGGGGVLPSPTPAPAPVNQNLAPAAGGPMQPIAAGAGVTIIAS